ncbi:hypothetical protein BJ165DRAFT_181644 [Panaeolus papilionaceus]|nr:hypothetical protein BJ165DRAFT_181644 [Panaeolus papilionaceus]
MTESIPARTHWHNPTADDSLTTDVKKKQSDNPGDIVMVVMGPTGVGKTTFIKSLTESYSLSKVGHHELSSGTQDIEIITVELGDAGKKLVLVDTPGFDDSRRPNSVVLTHISRYLEETYREKKYLSGLIYLQRITDVRFDSGAAASMNIFRKLYGNDSYDKLALVTTMWNDIRPDLKSRYERKEQELMTTTWSTFLKRANPALVARFDATDDSHTKTSALEVVTDLINRSLPTALKLRLQQELVDEGKKLPRTTAGRAAFTLAETAKFYFNEFTK